MGGYGSGGANRLPVELHLARGTYRQDRHAAALAAQQRPSTPVSRADRRAVLAGLGKAGRKVATRLLDDFSDWDVSGLHTLRQYAISCDRLDALQHDDDARRREARLNLQLLQALHLER